MNVNFDLFDLIFNILCSVTALILLIVIPFREQYRELAEPLDRYTRLRWILFVTLSCIILFSLAPIAYTVGRFIGNDLEWLRSIATYSSGLFKVAVSLGFTVIYLQRIPKE